MMLMTKENRNSNEGRKKDWKEKKEKKNMKGKEKRKNTKGMKEKDNIKKHRC